MNNFILPYESSLFPFEVGNPLFEGFCWAFVAFAVALIISLIRGKHD